MSSLRYQLHIFVAEILYYSGCLAAWLFLRTRLLKREQVCVLGLHRVLPEAEFTQSNALPGMLMKEATFASLLEFVSRRFKVVPLDEIGRAKGPQPHCAITFDDGWKDNYTNAYPWLKKYCLSATIFLVTGFIGSENGFWVEHLIGAWKNSATRPGVETLLASLTNGEGTRRQGGTYFHRSFPNSKLPPTIEKLIERLKRMPSAQRDQLLQGVLPAGPRNSDNRMLCWDEVLKMSQAGVSFGAHTVTHPLLPYEQCATAEREVRDSKLSLEQKLHKSVRAFAYPNGDWDAQARQHVAAAGYDWAFTTRYGWYRRGSDRYTIPRVLLHEGNITGRNGKFSPAMFTLTTVFGA